MRVALVYPEVYELARFKEKRKEFPPFGVLYLASVLEQKNIIVHVFPINKKDTQLNLSDYDIVGFSIPSSATYDIVKKSRFSSLYSGNPVIVAGGIHPSLYPQETLMEFQAQAVIIGSGERTLAEIVEQCHKRDFSAVKGICYLKDGLPRLSPTRPLEKDINWIPLPARHLLRESDFIMDNRLATTDIRMTHVLLSRGCPFSCRFCTVLQKKIQYRSKNSIRKEFEYLKDAYHIDGFVIVDDNFVVNKSYVKQICKTIEDLNLKWSVLSRVDTVDYELLEIMHNAGCIEIKFGVESGNEEILSRMGKNISVNQIKKAITLTSAVGIGVKIFLVHGFPGENRITTQDTISLLSEIAPMVDRVSLFRFVPLPGSYVFRNAKQFNLKISEPSKSWEQYRIYDNDRHWWGDKNDFQQLTQAYLELNQFITAVWGES